jgi:hypothetical protein
VTAPAQLIADLFPGDVRGPDGKRPEGVPVNAKLHVFVTTTQILIGWESGAFGTNQSQIASRTIEVTEEDTATADHNGGQVGEWTVARAGGCSCGKALKRWNPFAATGAVQVARVRPNGYGLPTGRGR